LAAAGVRREAREKRRGREGDGGGGMDAERVVGDGGVPGSTCARGVGTSNVVIHPSSNVVIHPERGTKSSCPHRKAPART
jgi:hypothetical protein